jgi:hypothetical protein
MSNSKYEKYEKPVAPTDPNAEYMTYPETAHTLHCSVRAIRRALKELGIRPGNGARIVTDRAIRAEIFRLRSVRTTTPIRRASTGRPRKAAVPQQASRKPARTAA